MFIIDIVELNNGIDYYKIDNQKFFSCHNCSIDKIKILVKSTQTIIDDIIRKNVINPKIKHYKSMSLSACKDNWLINYEEKPGKISNFYVGFAPNWYNNTQLASKYMVIEYNPNKINIEEHLTDFKILMHNSTYINYMYIDFAYDLDYKIEDLIIQPRHGNEYTAIVGHGGKKETMYFGKFGTCGAVKVYDKAKEQKIKNRNWTRYEIRIKDINYGNTKDILDKLRFNQINLYDDFYSHLETKEKLLFQVLGQDESILYTLDKRTQKKYKELLKQSLISLVFDNTSAVEVFEKYNFQYL